MDGAGEGGGRPRVLPARQPRCRAVRSDAPAALDRSRGSGAREGARGARSRPAPPGADQRVGPLRRPGVELGSRPRRAGGAGRTRRPGIVAGSGVSAERAGSGRAHRGERARGPGPRHRPFGTGPHPVGGVRRRSGASVFGGESPVSTGVGVPRFLRSAPGRLAAPAGHLRGSLDRRTRARERVPAAGIGRAGGPSGVGGRGWRSPIPRASGARPLRGGLDGGSLRCGRGGRHRKPAGSRGRARGSS